MSNMSTSELRLLELLNLDLWDIVNSNLKAVIP